MESRNHMSSDSDARVSASACRRRSSRALARFLMRLALRYELAEEVINDTFWVVWRQAERFRGDSRVSTWIMGIAYRRALRALRTARQASAACEHLQHMAEEYELTAAELAASA